MLNSLDILIVAPIFIIILAVCKGVIRSGLKTSDGASWILAACVAILAIIGITQPSHSNSFENQFIPFLLVLYGTLGLSILLSLLLTFLSKRYANSKKQQPKKLSKHDPCKYINNRENRFSHK